MHRVPHGKPWPRWAGEKLAQVAIEQHMVTPIAPGTMRTWLRQDQSTPWRSPAWQRSTAPRFVDQGQPRARSLRTRPSGGGAGEAGVCSDEKTSIQARQRVRVTKAAAPGYPLHVADR